LLHNFVEIYLQSLCHTESTLKLAQWQQAAFTAKKKKETTRKQSQQQQQKQQKAAKDQYRSKILRQVVLLNFYP